MSKTTDKKRERILDAAEKVFIEKGYNGVTMKDILDECEISRGGIYLYYDSVDAVFMAVILRHNASKLERVRLEADGDADFDRLLDEYFQLQKIRLLHMENSLMLAMFEFFLAHRHSVSREFFTRQFENTRSMILQLLQCSPEDVSSEKAELLSGHIMYLIEGLSTQAVSGELTEAQIDAQFDFAKSLIRSYGGHLL
jgi:AcrR family transcriptional regulator